MVKYAGELNGLWWDMWGYREPEIKIKISIYQMKGTRADHVQQIAKRWPVTWEREKPMCPDRNYPSLNWVATLDGVKLIIEAAEVFQPMPQMPTGDPFGEPG